MKQHVQLFVLLASLAFAASAEEIENIPDVNTDFGKPQRQEHDNQKSTHNLNEQIAVTTVNQAISSIEAIAKLELNAVIEDTQKIIDSDGPLSEIELKIDNLLKNFSEQVSKLKETIQLFTYGKKDLKLKLDDLENSFITSLKNLSKDVKQYLATKKAAKSSTALEAANIDAKQDLENSKKKILKSIMQGLKDVTQAIHNSIDKQF